MALETLIIGVAGPSCSGKSTLTRFLAAQLPGPVSVLPLDAYYKDLSWLPPEKRGERNFDVPDALDAELLEQHLRELVAGQGVERPIYDFASHTRSPGGVRVEPTPFLLVEGLFTLYWEEVRRHLGVSLFVEAPDALCLKRRKRRDVAERGRTPEEVILQYLTTVRPMAERFVLPTRRYADVVVQGSDPVEVSASRLGLVMPRAA